MHLPPSLRMTIMDWEDGLLVIGLLWLSSQFKITGQHVLWTV